MKYSVTIFLLISTTLSGFSSCGRPQKKYYRCHPTSDMVKDNDSQSDSLTTRTNEQTMKCHSDDLESSCDTYLDQGPYRSCQAIDAKLKPTEFKKCCELDGYLFKATAIA